MTSVILRVTIYATLWIVTVIMFDEKTACAQIYDRKWGFGVNAGILFSTIDSTVFAVGGNVDYYFTEDVSVGPLVQVAPGSDYTQANGWVVARLHYPTKYVDITPFAGPGFTYGRVAAGRLSTKSDDDGSLSMAVGVELGFAKFGRYALTASALYSFYKLSMGQSKDNGNGALMFGVSF